MFPGVLYIMFSNVFVDLSNLDVSPLKYDELDPSNVKFEVCEYILEKSFISSEPRFATPVTNGRPVPASFLLEAAPL